MPTEITLTDDVKKQLTSIMEKYGETTITDMVAILMRAGKLASGTLVSSFRAEVTDALKLIVSFEDYGRYVNYGRRPGKFAPPNKIKEWCRIKGIPEEYSFAINMNIFKFGITPTPFYNAFFKNIALLEKEVLDTLGQDVLDQMKYMIETEKIIYTGKKGLD